jgi:serine/threonine protein kinase
MPPLYRGGIPPEFFGSGVGGVETDIYQVGLTLYRAVNGDAFFQSQRPQTEDELREKTLAGTFPNRGKFLAHVPRPLARVIRKALRVNHLERYRTASDMSNALAKCTFDNDWATICRNDGGYDWSCSRDGQPGLEVELIKNGNRWNVNTFTVGDKRRRRNNLCLANARRAESQRHLRDVFAQLG